MCMTRVSSRKMLQLFFIFLLSDYWRRYVALQWYQLYNSSCGHLPYPILYQLNQPGRGVYLVRQLCTLLPIIKKKCRTELSLWGEKWVKIVTYEKTWVWWFPRLHAWTSSILDHPGVALVVTKNIHWVKKNIIVSAQRHKWDWPSHLTSFWGLIKRKKSPLFTKQVVFLWNDITYS